MRGVRVGDPVVVLPVEEVLADVKLLALPTVRRAARAGLRGVVLVPIKGFAGALLAAARIRRDIVTHRVAPLTRRLSGQ